MAVTDLYFNFIMLNSNAYRLARAVLGRGLALVGWVGRGGLTGLVAGWAVVCNSEAGIGGEVS